ncbi:TetR family transcriptional regulator [Streptomyces hoynatensis]|uniref:TetR/AcrR family transcriptional regulator n=1 Tax=Streptomyces hoynatensis TaxID=1141874 RepID=A0A3A9ZC97_9ACTN|nr:TetR family transcriptional regulator [Streptomyces hoynatensis]RKN45853.1 TetR/AcrR family transcriptional regulator [Streptomyces hoynatensis]
MSTQRQPAARARTERQRARRRRILDSTTRLAAAGGFDAVQMREVAESAQVALGTLYRYFPSKIHLLVAVLHDQLELLHATLRERPLPERDPAARVAHTLRRAFRAHQREPRLTAAMMRALLFADGSAREEVTAVSRLTSALLLDAAGLEPPWSEEELSAVRVIQHTWQSTLVFWLAGTVSLENAHADVETACRLLAGGRRPPARPQEEPIE